MRSHWLGSVTAVIVGRSPLSCTAAGAAASTQGPLYLATFCGLSITLGALLYNLTNVLNEYFDLQQQLTELPQARGSQCS